MIYVYIYMYPHSILPIHCDISHCTKAKLRRDCFIVPKGEVPSEAQGGRGWEVLRETNVEGSHHGKRKLPEGLSNKN